MRSKREKLEITTTPDEKTFIERRAAKGGWKSAAAYIREAALKYSKEQEIMKEEAHSQIAEISRKTYQVLAEMRRERLLDDNPIEQILDDFINQIKDLL